MQFSQQELFRPGENGMTYTVLKENNYQPRILYLANLTVRNKKGIKNFPNKS